MAIRGERREDEPRARAAHDVHDEALRRPVRPEVAIAEVEVCAEARAQNPGRLRGLPGAKLGRAARPHFATGQVDDAEARPAPRKSRQGSAATQLDVVRMRPEGQDLDGFHVHSPIT